MDRCSAGEAQSRRLKEPIRRDSIPVLDRSGKPDRQVETTIEQVDVAIRQIKLEP
jgi:hypothetical protein